MPIPKYDELTWPILELLKDGQTRSTHDLTRLLCDHFNLNEDDRSRLLPSGGQTYMLNRTGWAGFYLDRAGLITRPKRAQMQITDLGRQVVAGPPRKLDRRALAEFPQFAAFISALSAKKTGADLDPATGSATDEVTDASPEEQMANAFETLLASLKQELLGLVSRMDPVRFERVVLDLLLAMGYGGSREEAARMTSTTHDEGIDGVINEDRLGLDTIYIQAKRWQNVVGRREIQGFVGALAGKQAHKGIFITTSGFAQTAHDYVQSIPQKVILIDGDRLAELMIQHNVGVSLSHAYEIKKIDSDYFEDQ